MSLSGSSGISLFSDLLRICWKWSLNSTNLIQNLTYIRFGILLTQFYINFSRQEHQIELYMSQSTPEILRFQPIPSLIFPLQSLYDDLKLFWYLTNWRLDLVGVKPYRNPTYEPATYSNMAYFPGEHFF